MTTDDRIASAFTALAHPRRVRLFRLLCEQPELGRSVLDLRRATGYKDAPLLFHLRVMERSGLIVRRRAGIAVAQALATGGLARAIADIEALRRTALPPVRAAG